MIFLLKLVATTCIKLFYEIKCNWTTATDDCNRGHLNKCFEMNAMEKGDCWMFFREYKSATCFIPLFHSLWYLLVTDWQYVIHFPHWSPVGCISDQWIFLSVTLNKLLHPIMARVAFPICSCLPYEVRRSQPTNWLETLTFLWTPGNQNLRLRRLSCKISPLSPIPPLWEAFWDLNVPLFRTEGGGAIVSPLWSSQFQSRRLNGGVISLHPLNGGGTLKPRCLYHSRNLVIRWENWSPK